MKPCADCGISAKIDSSHSYCKDCNYKRTKMWRQANPDRLRGHVLKKRYDMTLDDWEERLLLQGKACGVCKTTVPGGRGRFQVDHDHGCCPGRNACKKCIRGLLCWNCNSKLGWYEKNALGVDAYLRRYQQV